MSDPQPEPQAGDEFKGASPSWVTEIIRQGELRLQSQLQAALAADARAGVLASIQAATAAALVVFGGSHEVVGDAERAAYVAAGVSLLGAGLACIALRPIPFDFPGLDPLDWAEAIQTNEPEDSSNRAYARYLDDYLKANAVRMADNGKWARLAMSAMMLSAPLALVSMAL